MAVEVCGRVIRAQSLPVTLADFSQDIDPVARFHTVIGLDVERPLWLDDLEHLVQEKEPQNKSNTAVYQLMDAQHTD